MVSTAEGDCTTMGSMRGFDLLFAVPLALTVLGCKKDPDARRDPVTTALPSTSTSSATSTLASAASIDPSLAHTGSCRDGVVVAPSTFDASLFGAPNDGPVGADGGSDSGSTQGLGLGSVGTFGHGAGTGGLSTLGGPAPHPAGLHGLVVALDGKLDAPSASRGICVAFTSFKPCFDAAKSAPGLSVLVGVRLEIDGEGHVASASAISQSHAAPSVVACVTDAAKRLLFSPPLEGKATLDYAFDYGASTKGVHMKEGASTIDGRLPPDVIRRIARANFPRLRACYEAGLKVDPKLKGTLAARFVIDATGAVTGAKLDPGTLADPTVRACMLHVFEGLSFPAPEGGTVKVFYPVDFTDEE